MKYTKRIVWALIAVMLLTVASGCAAPAVEQPVTSKPPAGTQAPAAQPAEKTLLRVQWIGDMQYEDAINPVSGNTIKGMKALEAEFEALHEDINLEYVIMGWDDYQKKTQSMILGKECDVYQVPAISALAAQGLLENLRPYIERDSFDLNVFIDGQVNGWMCVGPQDTELQIYGLPLISDTRFILYDKQLFDEWGVEYLSAEPTLEEIEEKAAKMTGANPVSGAQNYGLFYKGTDGDDALMNINEYYGGTWGEGISAASMQVRFNSETMIKALDKMVQLNKYCPEGVMSNQGGEAFGTAENNIAINMRCNPAVYFNIKALGLQGRYGVSRLFINEKEGMGGLFVGSPVAIASNCEVKDAAWEYLKFTSSDTFAKYFWENQNNEGLPTVKSALSFAGISDDENMTRIMGSIAHLWTPRYIYRADCRSMLQNAVEESTMNGKPASESLAAAQAEVDAWIALK